ncbi:IS701 family transposase (plasmid) [Streptomyces globisporus]|uniref:IS701 family transposase n=1 Tax=Streptomyces globisporus TaxID=1908 RepID=UPI002F91AE27|nr:IS701 family transposase [Streptomyces globisporus]
MAAEATVAERAWAAVPGAACGQITDCFERPGPRALAGEMCEAMLMEVDTRNCWTLAEARGHRGPHRLQHFLSRAMVDHDTARDRIAAWTAGELAAPEAVLIVDETGDEKSLTDCVGAAHQYSGALGGIGLCQVAVHLTYASRHGHAPIDRTLYLGREWTADEERRLLTHVPDGLTFATKPQLVADMLTRARGLGVPARWLAGDEVYGSRELRLTARALGFDHALAVRCDHRVDTAIGRTSVTDLATRVPRKNWMLLRTGHGLKGDRPYDWAMLDIRPDDTPDDQEPGHSFVLVRRHRYTRELSFHRCHPARPVTLADLVDVVYCRWGGRRLPARQGHLRPRPGPDHLLELLDALDPDQHARHRRPRDHPRPHRSGRSRNHTHQTHAGQRPRTPAPATDHRAAPAPPRSRPHAALLHLAPPPSVPGSRGPPPLDNITAATTT